MLSAEHAAMTVRGRPSTAGPARQRRCWRRNARSLPTDQDRAHLRFAEASLALTCPGTFAPDRRPRPLTPDEIAGLPNEARQCAIADNAAVMAALHGHPEPLFCEAETVLQQAVSGR